MRLETYVMEGERGSGVICLNGSAARLVRLGDNVIIISYVILTDEDVKLLNLKLFFLVKQ